MNTITVVFVVFSAGLERRAEHGPTFEALDDIQLVVHISVFDPLATLGQVAMGLLLLG